jgi:NAD(P)H-hydrate epimerase
MTLGLPEDGEGRLTEQGADLVLKRKWDALLIGPGLGQSTGIDGFVSRIVQGYAGPIVIDADGLNSIARRKDFRGLDRAILTPHAGEFQRLMGKSADEPIVDRVGSACELQRRTGGVIILKGAGSVVVGPGFYHVNMTGNPGMATGGTGDVLAGMLVGLLGQGWSIFDAGRLAVHLHGRAGDIVAHEKGEISLIARDLLDAIPRAFIQYTAQ